MKKYIIILGVVLVAVCGFGGYYVWCMYHPYIDISIGEGSAGKNLKLEAPYMISTDRANKTADSVNQNMLDFIAKHEEMIKYLQDNYITSDIKLDIVVKDGQTILKYEGNATVKSGESVAVKKEKICDFVLDAEINKR